MQADDRGFTNVLTMTFPTAKRFEADRDRAFADFVTLVDRAKAAGKLRTDFCTARCSAPPDSSADRRGPG